MSNYPQAPPTLAPLLNVGYNTKDSAARNSSTIDFFEKRKLRTGSRLTTNGQVSPDFQAANLRYGGIKPMQAEMSLAK